MDVLTSETCSALNNEIIKRVTSSWSLFIQLSRRMQSNKHKIQHDDFYEGSKFTQLISSSTTYTENFKIKLIQNKLHFSYNTLKI